jgi:hypothetical protein
VLPELTWPGETMEQGEATLNFSLMEGLY